MCLSAVLQVINHEPAVDFRLSLRPVKCRINGILERAWRWWPPVSEASGVGRSLALYSSPLCSHLYLYTRPFTRLRLPRPRQGPSPAAPSPQPAP